MKSAWKLCAILFLATSLVAQTSTPPKPKKAKVKPGAAAITAADVQALKDAIASQQAAIVQQGQQIQELRDALQRKDQAVMQAQTAATDAAGKASAAQAQAAQQQQTVSALSTDVTDLKANLLNTTVSVQETQKNVNAAMESPTALHYKGITITPGGFLAAEFVRRSRALGADINTPLNSLTMPGASQSTTSEFFGTGRQSRISMLAQGQLTSVKLSGYYEADFLSAGVTSNNNESNSYTLRQRQAWAQAAFNNGWSVTGGQMWSLVTETKHGLDNRTEAVPMTIDPQYNVGFSWARQYGLRLTKNIGNKVWFGVSIENAQATLSTHNNGDNFLVGSAGASGGLYNAGASASASGTAANLANYSFNPSPDVVAKLAFEPGFGHYEIFGVYSRFRDRVFPCGEVTSTETCGGLAAGVASALTAFNSSKNGGGVGANARWSFVNKHLDFGLHFLGGSGVGRYGTGSLPDASVHANGTLDLIKSYQGLGTLEWHGPKVDIYLNAGAEYAGRASDYDPLNAKLYVGYGSPFFSNSGCYTETPPSVGSGFFPGSLSSCTADTRVLYEGTIGIWFKPYDGSREKVNRGRIQWGPQFSYVDRQAWSGAGTPNSPHGLDGMIYTSFRYYLP
ncbi:MAG TPA: hypothetical protein VN310_01075 [Candidatus Dormibacteraeota bacterium]|jgi:hypothetical protein|nr:hypothetical protein [Candidatus Dormibacteraeota bacterium]